ncbi:TldD/PmbA family protein [Pannus brasiliensis CCIBt3594]|uniref:TldD/PmbA family protein n=1 Tax=Pannus brasiliensis CCIBt3594 TaxID=1427578 RepID=A0AAW9QSZ3_9CHRO
MTIDPREIIDLALKSGASRAEVYQSSSISRPVFFEANRLKQLESSESEGTALRLWREGCPGLAVGYGDVEPSVLVETALELSRLNVPEEIEFSPPREAIYPEVGRSIEVEALIDMGTEIIARIRDKYPEVLCSGELECERDTTRLVNSEGLYCEYIDTAVSYYAGIEWVRGEDFLAVYDGEYTRGIPNPDPIVEQLLQRLQWAEANVSPPTGRVPILFTPNAATMLWGTVAAALNGKQVLEKSSPWSEKIGESVVSEQITMSQQPDRDPYGCPFDDEGTPTRFLSLLEKGRVREFYLDRTTARILGKQTTGNGFRPSLGVYPMPDLVNLIIEPGEGTLAELIAGLDDAVVIDQILGHGADISGDFSVNIDLGYRVQKGKITGRVKDTMVAGNVYTALQQTIALGADNQWNGSCYTPSIVVDSLSVVG